jgi:nucleotide-binding universal stress UspA family protein
MKLLIAYDGSSYSDDALAELPRAGLPRQLDALVLSVADVWLPAHPNEVDASLPAWLQDQIKQAYAESAKALATAEALAERGRERLAALFPDSSITARAIADSPGWGIVNQAGEWGADLVLVGSHGHSGVDGLVLGTVSQLVLTEAACSVRVGRKRSERDDPAIRVLVGFDGSANAEAAVQTVSDRAWPAGTRVSVVTVVDPRMTTGLAHPFVQERARANPEEPEPWWENSLEAAADKIKRAGLDVSITIREGDPKLVLVAEASRWQADCIFLGYRGMSPIERLTLGSVSTAVASRAPCSVEVVHDGRELARA